jgi:hypothetical protein
MGNVQNFTLTTVGIFPDQEWKIPRKSWNSISIFYSVHPAKRARAQELYIVSSYTYAFNETFTCVWIFLWSVSLEWQEAHLDDGFTQTIPPASPQIFKWSICSSSLPLIGRRAGPWLGDTGPDWAILKRKQIREKTKFICDSDSIYKLCCTYV